MLQDSMVCIITNFNEIKHRIEESKQKPEYRQAISDSIMNLTPEKLKAIYNNEI